MRILNVSVQFERGESDPQSYHSKTEQLAVWHHLTQMPDLFEQARCVGAPYLVLSFAFGGLKRSVASVLHAADAVSKPAAVYHCALEWRELTLQFSVWNLIYALVNRYPSLVSDHGLVAALIAIAACAFGDTPPQCVH